MTDLGYLIAGWSIGLGSIAAYAVVVVLRGRDLSRKVPPERHRWMTTDD